MANHFNDEIAKHAGDVKLMTCAQHATSKIGYHAIVAICSETGAIVIDHSLNSTAFRLILGQVDELDPYIPLFNEKAQERSQYFIKDDDEYRLAMNSALPDSSYPPLSFTDEDVDAAVSPLAIPAAKEVKPLKGQNDIVMPPRKYVSVRSLLNEESYLLASVPVNGKFLSTTLRMQSPDQRSTHPAMLKSCASSPSCSTLRR
jgi:hypothetical protein